MRTWGLKLIAALAVVMAASVLPAFATTASVTIHANKSSYVAGQTATLSFTIANAGQHTNLRVVATYANGTVKTLNDTDVYTDQVPNENLYMYYNVRIDAYVGGATEPSGTLSIPVKAAVAIAIGGYYQRDGYYAVFAPGTQPVFQSATTPARTGRCIRHEVWRRSSSGWKTVGLSACKYENSQGAVTWRWAGTHPSGVHFRVRAKFLGDHLNHANASKYIYFRFA